MSSPTGHNLDDEAATLLGNTIRWKTEYIARQFPVLPPRDGMVKKVKPLYRLAERRPRLRFPQRIDYVVENVRWLPGTPSSSTRRP